MRLPFGEWLPDLPEIKAQGALTVCKNAVPIAGGYGPQASLVNLDSFAVSAAPKGAIRGQLSDGTNLFVAGTKDKLERRLEAGWTDVSRAAGYTDIVQRRWSIVQFGSSVFAANGVDEMQGFDLAVDTRFRNVVGAPRAQHLLAAENFLWAGDLFSSTIGVARDAVAWSGVADPYRWPDPFTDQATAALSGQQVLEGNGGLVMGLVSGSEVIAIFQENAIHRADFVGNDVVWRISRVATDHGLSIKSAALAIERGVLFIAEDGFRLFNYTTSQNIGKDKINDFFFNDFDADYPDSVSMSRDPSQTRAYISYPGSGHVNGVPNRILVWDWALNQWVLLEPGPHHGLIGAGAGGIAASLDSPGTAEDPDRIGGAAADTDPPGDQSFDDRQLGSSRITLGAFDATFRLAAFSGNNLPATFETGDMELTPGFRSLLTEVRPQVDGGDATVQVAGTQRRGVDTRSVEYGQASKMDVSGKCSVRKDARFHRLRFNLPKTFTKATEFDMKFVRTGSR